jgi:hypothetical protein
MAELIWDGKYDEHGNKRAPVRIELPFQTVETVNESVQERQRTLELSSSGHDPEWRNRLIWGDKKYVLPSLLPEFAGKVNSYREEQAIVARILVEPVDGASMFFGDVFENPDHDARMRAFECGVAGKTQTTVLGWMTRGRAASCCAGGACWSG